MTTSEIVDCKSLPPGSLLDVETKNRPYQIEFLGGHDILISGHPDLCPTPVTVKLRGSSDKKGVLEPDLISCGRHLQFLMDDHRPVTTSRVLKVRVQRAAPASSIH
jgi:hypothetical protein